MEYLSGMIPCLSFLKTVGFNLNPWLIKVWHHIHKQWAAALCCLWDTSGPRPSTGRTWECWFSGQDTYRASCWHLQVSVLFRKESVQKIKDKSSNVHCLGNYCFLWWWTLNKIFLNGLLPAVGWLFKVHVVLSPERRQYLMTKLLLNRGAYTLLACTS